MNADGEKHLRRILAEAGVQDGDQLGADWWLREERKFGTPALAKALFLREAWREVISSDNARWLEQALAEIDRRKGDGDEFYSSRVAKRSPELLDEISSLAALPRGREALTLLVRAAQIKVLASVMQLLDGGYTFDEGLAASWVLCGTDSNGDPTQSLGNVGELMWVFDPERGH